MQTDLILNLSYLNVLSDSFVFGFLVYKILMKCFLPFIQSQFS